jgi:threonine dehydratase
MNAEEVKAEALEAERRIRGHIRETPLEHSLPLSRAAGGEVFLKLENLQISSSFKFRGAINSVLALDEPARRRGLVTASTGNHGMAFAHALRVVGCEGTIYLPETAAAAKVRDLQSHGASLKFVGDDGVISEMQARRDAEEQGLTFISPYNDPTVIGGQGTIGIELERQAGAIDSVLVPVGGGGLIGGIAGYLKSQNPNIEIIGCQPANSAVIYESVKAGHIVEMESLPTLSDGSAGGVEPGAITLDLCRNCVDDWVLVSEAEIAAAIRLILEDLHVLVEGAGALSTAAFLQIKDRFAGKRVVLVLSGARISLETLMDALGETRQ